MSGGNIFSSGGDQQRPGVRVSQRPGGNQSSNIFGGGPDEEPQRTGRKMLRNANEQSEQQQPPAEAAPRSGVRVAQVPGGNQSLNLFGGPSAAPQEAARGGRRQIKNASDESASEEPAPVNRGVRVSQPAGGQQSFNAFGGPATEAAEKPKAVRAAAVEAEEAAPARAAPSAPAAAPTAAASEGKAGPRSFYPPIEPYDKGFLQVSRMHKIYYEQCGNPRGKPAVFLHGGPGGGISPYHRQYFDPKAYRIVLFDQRGAGKSTPSASLEENTTWDLIDDTEKLRAHLGIGEWVVFGGSWGSTLALAYAEKHPDKVLALVLRGVFLFRYSELHWFYQDGASHIFPDAWEKFLAPIPEVERNHLMSAYHRRLTGADDEERIRCAKAWTEWEMTTSRLLVDHEAVAKASEDAFANTFARIEAHYMVNGAFFDSPNQLLESADRLRDIPGIIVQGRYDLVCPARSAWDLSKVWPSARLVIVPDAGHSAKEPGIVSALVEATDFFRD